MKRMIGTLLLVLAGLLGAAPAAHAVTPTEVVVEDTAGVLDQATLLPAVEAIDFYEPTKVAVYTYNGSGSANLNEEVLRFARAEHPEWLSPDGQKWADGLFIFALDPVGRLGRDLYGRGPQDPAGAARGHPGGHQGTVPGRPVDRRNHRGDRARRGADQPPWYRSGAFIGSLWAAGIAVVGFFGVRFGVRRQNLARARREIERGDRSFSNVSMDLDATEVNANTIPPTSEYGSRVLEKYRGFMTGYTEASKLNDRVHAMGEKELKSGKNVKTAVEYARIATELDALDDVIADTNTFLNLASGWERAWDRQLAPLREDLDGIDSLLEEGPETARSAATAAALRSFRDRTREDLEDWAAGLADGRTTPDAALRLIQDNRGEFTELLKAHADTVIDAYAKTSSEKDKMREDMDEELRSGERRSSPTILDTVYPPYMFYSAYSFNAGYSSAQSSVDSSRSSGSTTGYGSSGGSFSGSGSSSRF